MFLKNTAGQKLMVFAFTTADNTPKTGDAANITAYVDKDYGGVNVLGDTSATEKDSTNAKGYYLFDLTQAETNAEVLQFSAKSATSGVMVIAVPATVFTTTANWSTLTQTQVTGGAYDVTNASCLIHLAADQAVNATKVGGQTASASGTITFNAQVGSDYKLTVDSGGRGASNMTYMNGVSIAGTSTQVADRFVYFFNVAASTSTANTIKNIDDNVTLDHAALGNVTYGLSALQTLLATTGIKVLSLANGALTSSAVATGFLSSNAFATGALTNNAFAANCLAIASFASDIGTTALASNPFAKAADLATFLKPTTAGRTLDVTTTGEAGIDWSNIGAPTTTVALTGTTVGVVSSATLAASQHVIVDSGTVTNLTYLPAVTNDWLTAAGVKADAVTKIQAGLAKEAYLEELIGAGWDVDGNAVLGDTGIIGMLQVMASKSGELTDEGLGGHGAGEAMTLATMFGDSHGYTYNPATDANEALRDRGDSAWVTGTFPTNFSALVISGSGVVSANASVDASAVAAAMWSSSLSGYTAGQAGYILNAAGAAGDPWSVSLPGSYAANTAGYIIGHSGGVAPKPGAYTDTITIEAPGTTTPLEGVWVWVTTDSGGTDTGTTVWGKEATNGSGIVTASLDAGTYWVHAAKPGYMFDTTWPRKLTVTVDGFSWSEP
jgi:hypothetical protein